MQLLATTIMVATALLVAGCARRSIDWVSQKAPPSDPKKAAADSVLRSMVAAHGERITNSFKCSTSELAERGFISNEDAQRLRDNEIQSVQVRPQVDGFFVWVYRGPTGGGMWRIPRSGPAIDLSEEWNRKSADLARDTVAMWKEITLDGETWSTSEAVAAAIRVFNTVPMRGRKRDEIMSAIGAPANPTRHIVEEEISSGQKQLIFHFETGFQGIAVIAKVDQSGRVRSVEKKWIH